MSKTFLLMLVMLLLQWFVPYPLTFHPSVLASSNITRCQGNPQGLIQHKTGIHSLSYLF